MLGPRGNGVANSASGNQRAKYDYDPFGVPLTSGKLSGGNENVLYNAFGFTGKQHDRETGSGPIRAKFIPSKAVTFSAELFQGAFFDAGDVAARDA